MKRLTERLYGELAGAPREAGLAQPTSAWMKRQSFRRDLGMARGLLTLADFLFARFGRRGLAPASTSSSSPGKSREFRRLC